MAFLLEQGISALPVNPCAIPPKNGWMIFSYSAFAARIQESAAYLQAHYDKDGFVLWSEPAQTFVVCYNDSAPQNEIRWTVTHEIGHIRLRHVSPGRPVLARHGAGNRLYELEAESFALRVLCPAPVLRECGVDSPEEIAGMWASLTREPARPWPMCGGLPLIPKPPRCCPASCGNSRDSLTKIKKTACINRRHQEMEVSYYG